MMRSASSVGSNSEYSLTIVVPRFERNYWVMEPPK
jgi:hypothetical protein